MWKRYLKNKQGQGMSEYLILVLLIAVGSIAATQSMGTTVVRKIRDINHRLNDVNFSDTHGD